MAILLLYITPVLDEKYIFGGGFAMEDKKDNGKLMAETEAYLARVKKTVSASKALIEQAKLRIAETDRLLEEQGLTREQVMAMRFTPEQKQRVNEELKRRGLPPIDMDELPVDDARLTGEGRAAEPNMEAEDVKPDLENRKRKFNVMMSNIKL